MQNDPGQSDFPKEQSNITSDNPIKQSSPDHGQRYESKTSLDNGY